MREKWVKLAVILLLVALDAGLLIYFIRTQRSESEVPAEVMSQVESLYEKAGINLTADMSEFGKNEEWYSLELETADLDQMVESFLGEQEFSRSYLYGSKTQYTLGTISITTSREQHTITYRDSSVGGGNHLDMPLSGEENRAILRSVARRFAVRFMGDEVYLSEERRDQEGYRFTYHQMSGDTVYYFNSMTLLVTQEGVKSAVLTYWEVAGEGESLQTLTPDEALYAALYELTDGKSSVSVLLTVSEIHNAYVISAQTSAEAVAVPELVLQTTSGKEAIVKYAAGD